LNVEHELSKSIMPIYILRSIYATFKIIIGTSELPHNFFGAGKNKFLKRRGIGLNEMLYRIPCNFSLNQT